MSSHSHQYVPGHEPPSRLDRVLAAPFIVPVSFGSFVVGVLVLLSTFSELEVSRSIAEIEVWAGLTIAVPLIVGGPLSLAGALHVRGSWSMLHAMFLERVGNIAIFAGWLAYGLAVSTSGNHLATVTAWIGLSVAVAYGLRCWALYASEKRVRRSIEVDDQLGR